MSNLPDSMDYVPSAEERARERREQEREFEAGSRSADRIFFFFVTIPFCLAVALGGLYLLVRFVKFAWAN